MAKQFYERLREYYLNVAEVLRGEAGAASIFPNTTDVGMSREKVYAEFLRLHAPSKCNVFFGGFLFSEDGSESAQLDVLITTDTTPRFDFHNKDGNGKSFAPVEGTLAIASIKTMLNKESLEDALGGIASIPPTMPLGSRVNPQFFIGNYDDWPYKIIYASDGIAVNTLMGHLEEYYLRHPEISNGRRPNIIHVLGKYIIHRAGKSSKEWKPVSKEIRSLEENQFHFATLNPDIQGIIGVLWKLQERASTSSNIHYTYGEIWRRANGFGASDDAND
jgi:hypothetical protein